MSETAADAPHRRPAASAPPYSSSSARAEITRAIRSGIGPARHWRCGRCSTTRLRKTALIAERLEHELHGHQHGIVAADQPPLGDTTGVVDQCDVEAGFQGATGPRRDAAGGDREFGREGIDDASVGEARADGRADAAVDCRARDAAVAAEAFERFGEILVGPQPQCEGTAGGLSAAGLARYGSEQFEVRLGIRLGGGDGAVEAEGVDVERL